MAKTYSVCNQKGGVGKTTTAVNVAAFLALQDYNVLLVDLDPQGNATSAVGMGRGQVDKSIYDVLIDGEPVESVIKRTKTKNLYILPSTITLAGAEIELVGEMAREFKLREALKNISDSFDYIIIDTPPSLSLLTINSLAATDEVLIPIQCEYFALEGLSQLLKTIELVKTNLHNSLKIGGIILTMYDSRLILNNEVLEEVREHFPDIVFNTTVPRNVRLCEAPSFGMPILFYDSTSTGSLAYENITKELLERDNKIYKKLEERPVQQEDEPEQKGEIRCQSQNAGLAEASAH